MPTDSQTMYKSFLSPSSSSLNVWYVTFSVSFMSSTCEQRRRPVGRDPL